MNRPKDACHALCTRCMEPHNCLHDGHCGDKCPRCLKERDTPEERARK